MTKYLHTMIRISSLEDTIAFFEVVGLREIRRRPDEKGRYTNVFQGTIASFFPEPVTSHFEY
jgi:lactoylglutathione lyase